MAMSNGTNTAVECLSSASKMGYSQTHQSSVVTFDSGSQTATPQAIRDWLIASQVDSPANHFQLQESKLEPTTQEICGPQCLNAYASYDPDSRLWKMFQASLFQDISEPSWETWPKAGMTRAGVFYPQPKWERRINEIGSGLFVPTPTVSDTSAGESRLRGDYERYRGMDLATYAAVSSMQVLHTQKWPTPRTTGLNGGSGSRQLIQAQLDAGIITEVEATIMAEIKMFPTPRANKTDGYSSPGYGLTLSQAVGGKLNPTWVDWLMGFPTEWTALRPLEMPKFRLWLQQHGVYSLRT